MNPAAFLVPSAARLIPEKTKERSLALHSIRQLWHILFDPCPILARNGDCFEPFLEHAGARSLSMRWPLHGHALLWLRENSPEKMSSDLCQELLAAAAARWTNSDQTQDKGLLLIFSEAPRTAVAGWKCRTAREEPRVVLIELPEQNLPGRGVFAATFSEWQYPDEPRWRPLPD